MDGRGRFLDNIFIERLWRSLKYEAVYLYELRDGVEAERIIRLVDRLLQRGAPALVAGRADTGRGLSRKHGGVVRTIPARRHSWRANRRNDACERGGIAARRFPPSSHRKPVPTGRRRLYSNRARRRASAPAGSGPGGPRPDVLALGPSEITEGFRDYRNPP